MREQDRDIQERNQLRFELDQVQGLYQEAIRKVDKKTAKQVVPSTSPAIRSRPESRIDFVETPRTARHFNLDSVAQEQMSADLDAGTAPESMPSMGELEAKRDRSCFCR